MGLQDMIVVAVLCFNEERTIGSVVLKVKLCPKVDEVVVVDDGSLDDSLEIAQDAGAKVIEHGYNRGYGAATMTAIKYGRESRCDLLVIMDGDGQHDAADIPSLIQPIEDSRADVVIGSRFMKQKNTAPLYRRFGQLVITTIGSIAFGSKLSDNQCGFRALNKRALKSINLVESGMGASVELHQQIGQRHLRCVQVPVRVWYE